MVTLMVSFATCTNVGNRGLRMDSGNKVSLQDDIMELLKVTEYGFLGNSHIYWFFSSPIQLQGCR